MVAVSPYTTATVLGRPKPAHVVNVFDQERVQTYWTYDDIYHNVPDALKALLRSADSEELLGRRYVPVGRALIEATNRYLGKDLTWVTPPLTGVTPEQQIEAVGWLNAVFDREAFVPLFLSMKRWMLVRGDGAIHISADPNKPEGQRIRITELDPSRYFPITDNADAERVLGCYVISIVPDDTGEEIVQRLEYQRILTPVDQAKFPGSTIGGIWTRISFYEVDGWDDRDPLTEADLAPVDVPSWFGTDPASQAALAGGMLPAQITALPVYWFPNNRSGSNIFGISELQGLESLLAGVTQTTTDEDLAVGLQGIGVYWTDSGRPVDEAGQPAQWEIGPASILELQKGSKLGRVDGATNIDSLQGHAKYLENKAQETSGTPAIAVGRVDVKVAESGVALMIEMAPILSKNAEKEAMLIARLNQLLFDMLNGWLPAYEGLGPNGAVVQAEFGDPLPTDRKALIEELNTLITAKIISAEYARTVLAEKLGMVFPADIAAQIMAEQQASQDVLGTRMDAAIAGDTGGTPPEPTPAETVPPVA